MRPLTVLPRGGAAAGDGGSTGGPASTSDGIDRRRLGPSAARLRLGEPKPERAGDS